MSQNNPISELVSDETYKILNEKNFLNGKEIRNYLMRNEFKKLRKTKISASKAIELVAEKFSNLEFDTVRKIIYSVK